MKKYKPSEEKVCRVCGLETCGGKELTNHIMKEHKLKSSEYTIQYILNGVKPVCLECGGEPRYVAFSFKKYCKEHSHIAEREAGKLGGKNKVTWNKGLTKSSDERILKQSESLKGTNNPFYGRTHSPETIKNIQEKKRLDYTEFMERINSRSLEFKLLSTFEDYERRDKLLSFECLKCGRSVEKTLRNFECGSECEYCTKTLGTSKAERQIAQLIENFGLTVEKNTRRVIHPKELDLYIPDKNVAIEYHGLFWHSGGLEGDVNFSSIEEKKKAKNKFELCREIGIKLLQFYSDEWNNKQDIVTSMIRNRLGLIENKIGARECYVCVITQKEAKPFLEESHIDGCTRSSIFFGLKHKKTNELLSVMSFRKPIQKKYGEVAEISRFATKLNTVIPGGAAKLFEEAKKWAKEKGFEGILTYADLRFGTGDVYSKLGFEYMGTSGLNYWYTDGLKRMDRFKFRAQDGMTEKEYAEKHKVRPIWGPGHNIYLYSLTEKE